MDTHIYMDYLHFVAGSADLQSQMFDMRFGYIICISSIAVDWVKSINRSWMCVLCELTGRRRGVCYDILDRQ